MIHPKVTLRLERVSATTNDVIVHLDSTELLDLTLVLDGFKDRRAEGNYGLIDSFRLSGGHPPHEEIRPAKTKPWLWD